MIALLFLVLAETTAVPAPADAEALFREGLKAYDAKQFARAIDSFEAAHKLSGLPEILFDIAMARRALGDCPGAANGFEAFIAAAPEGDPLLARARARRAELGACSPAAANDATAPKIETGGKPSPLPSPRQSSGSVSTAPMILISPAAPARSPRQDRRWLRTACFASVGGTAALSLGGVALGFQALSAQDQVERATAWDDAAKRTDERGHVLGQVATTLLISAGVTAALAAASCFAMSRFKGDL